jgi:hypothetical protein
MQRIAAPMVGGMVTALLLSMFVVPAVYLLLRRRLLPSALHHRQAGRTGAGRGESVPGESRGRQASLQCIGNVHQCGAHP